MNEALPQAAAIHGILAQFETPEDLMDGVKKAYAAGYRKMDAYSPMPIHGLAEALGFQRPILPLLVFLGGLAGIAAGYGLQYWSSVIEYPLNIGGRPLHSWPAFIPVTFEMTILFAAGAAVFGMLALNRLPMPYHPVFNVESFRLASSDRFFLCIEAGDPKFDPAEVRGFLESLGASDISEVDL